MRNLKTQIGREFWAFVDKTIKTRDPNLPIAKVGESWTDSRHDLSASLANYIDNIKRMSKMNIGDKIILYLDEEIKKAEKEKKKLTCPYIVQLWKDINNLEGIITEIDGDNIWVRGNNIERCFNKETLRKA